MQEKIRKFSSDFMSIAVKAVLILIAGFILFSLGKSIWKNYLVVQNINAVKNDIINAENENKNLKNLIIYYQTDTYKELEARRKLGYKKPGENVLIIPEINPREETKTNLNTPKNDQSQENQTANFFKWYHYVIK
jgi:cell division protein FtsB